MKKLVLVVVSLVLSSSLFAGDYAQLRMKISGPIKDNRYFLCVSGVGCVSILNGNHGHAYPLDTGPVTSIRAINATNMSLRSEGLPSSCSVSVNSNQTLTVLGRIVEGANHNFNLTGVHCTVR